MFGKTTNQQKRNKIIKNAGNMVYFTKNGIKLMTKKKSTYGSNTLANGTNKSITVLQKYINSPLFITSPVNRKMLMKYLNRQIKHIGEIEKTKMIILQKNNRNRLEKQRQKNNRNRLEKQHHKNLKA